MKRLLLGSALALALTGIGSSRTGATDEKFKTRIFGSIPNIAVRGIPSAGAPWVTGPSRVTLRSDGSLRARIRGLVLAAGLNAGGTPLPAALVGTNPVSQVKIAVTWAVPASVSPSAVFVQETPVLPLDADGDLSTMTTVGPPPAGAERPVVLVRIANPATGASGPFIALSDFARDFGSSERDDD